MTSYRPRRLGRALLLILALVVVAATSAAFFGLFGSLGFGVSVIAMLAFIALCQPKTGAGRRKVLVWLVAPGSVALLAVYWQLLVIANGVQENCDSGCVTKADIHAGRIAFLIATGAWIIGMGMYLSLRARRKGGRAGRR